MEKTYHQRRILDVHSFLSHFEDVRDCGERHDRHQYEAKCPAHDTNHRSLAIAYFRDGRYGVHCHAGCGAAEVLGAAGLSLTDLYPDGALSERIQPRQKSQAKQVAEMTLGIADEWRKQGKRLSRRDLAQERQAWIAIRKAR